MTRTSVLRAVTAAALILVSGSLLLVCNTGVREVHRAGEPVNFALVDSKPASGDWPSWRGADATNTAPFATPPIHWSVSGNRGWQVAVPGRGHSSPCLWGQQIFLTTTDTDRKTISLLCFDRDSGQSVWQTELHHGGWTPTHSKNSHASSSPACDGQHVYVTSSVNGVLWVTAVNLDGRIAWQREAGPLLAKWGYASSPTTYKSLVIVAADNKGPRLDRVVGASHLTALHRQTGEVVWRVRRPAADSFASPVVAHIAGRDQLLLPGRGAVTSYDPATGDLLWTCRWSADWAANSVAFDQEHVFASTRHPRNELICIRADGRGDVTETHVVWRDTKSASEVPSPVAFQGRVYSLADDGILACLESATGKVLWKRRLGGNFSSSPLIAGQHLYCCNEEGIVFVVKPGGRGEVIFEHQLGAPMFASPIVSHDRLFIRTLNGLHCIVPSEARPVVEKPEEMKRRL